MKRLYFFTTLLFISAYAARLNAQEYRSLERIPEYEGGNKELMKYIVKNLKYPEAARLLGLAGKVQVSFIIDTNGTVSQVEPTNCVGAGCESEAVRVIKSSKPWLPGIQDNKPVPVHYTLPITFSLDYQSPNAKVAMKDLRKSAYGFVFFIKGKTYSLDEAETLLGKSFKSTDIASAEAYLNNTQYSMPEKKEVYLIVMKS